MKRFLIFLACLVTVSALALAESLPEEGALIFAPTTDESPSTTEDTPEPTASPAPDLASNEGELQLDFSVLTPDNPAATPVAVDPIDMPTPTPMPEPDFIYETYTNTSMGISFSIPYTWLLNPNTDLTSTVQFVEPKSEMMEPDGYQTRLTILKVNTGLAQTASDARARLEETLTELATGFTSFTPGEIASGSFGDAQGFYCYYRAEYNDGTKNYSMNGRVIIVAKGNALYQIRLTAPRTWYSYYNILWRAVRQSIKYL